MIELRLTLNGREKTVFIEKRWTVMKLLREKLLLTGTKCGCGSGDCGACMVLLNGEAVTSCNLPAIRLEGQELITIEGIAGSDGTLHPLQQAFIEAGAVQCGFCTPGMIIQGSSLLIKNPDPTKEEIQKAFEKNICRCTGYEKIIKAVQIAALNLKSRGL